jgi:prolyl-tRNA synthetase
MAHSDDDGLRLPPKVAPKHVVLLPVIPKPELEQKVLTYVEELAAQLRTLNYGGRPLAVHVDKRDIRGGEKNWQWIKKGIPLRIEVGPRDIESNSVALYRRDKPHKDRMQVGRDNLPGTVLALLDEMQSGYFEQARAHRDSNIVRDIKSFEEFKAFFTPKNVENPEIHGGFVLAKWCNDPAMEEKLAELKVTIRCMPLEQSGTPGKCVVTGRDATVDAIFAKSY